MRELPGFLDRKNQLNIARWRMRHALASGNDLLDLRPTGDLVISVVCEDNSMPDQNWERYDRPTVKRLKKLRESVPAFLRRQAS